jgi:hypothetical protein
MLPCGACVPYAPDSLFLRDLHLPSIAIPVRAVIDVPCALSMLWRLCQWSAPHNGDRYDVVIGAGPAGRQPRYALLYIDVLLIEKRQEIGVPVRCGEATG